MTFRLGQTITASKLTKIFPVAIFLFLGAVFVLPKNVYAQYTLLDNLASESGSTPYLPSGSNPEKMGGNIVYFGNSVLLTGFSLRNGASTNNCSSSATYLYAMRIYKLGSTTTLVNDTEFNGSQLGCSLAFGSTSNTISFTASPSDMGVLTAGYYYFGFYGRRGTASTFPIVPAYSTNNDLTENICTDTTLRSVSQFSSISYNGFDTCANSGNDEWSLILYGGQSIYATSRILQVFSPRANQVLSTINSTQGVASFSFDFYNRDSYSVAGVELNDMTLNASINTSFIEYNFNASGVGHYRKHMTLGKHLYRWRPYIRDTSGNYVFGTYAYFRIGSLEDNFVEYNNDFTASESGGYVEYDFSDRCDDYFPDTGNWLSIKSYGNAFARGICNGFGALVVPSSTSLNEFNDSMSSVKEYFPLSTVNSVYEAVTVLMTDSFIASNSSYASLTFQNLDFDTTVSHSVDITIFRMASVSEYIPPESIALVRNVFKYFLWFTFVFTLFYTLSKIFSV